MVTGNSRNGAKGHRGFYALGVCPSGQFPVHGTDHVHGKPQRALGIDIARLDRERLSGKGADAAKGNWPTGRPRKFQPETQCCILFLQIFPEGGIAVSTWTWPELVILLVGFVVMLPILVLVIRVVVYAIFSPEEELRRVLEGAVVGDWVIRGFRKWHVIAWLIVVVTCVLIILVRGN